MPDDFIDGIPVRDFGREAFEVHDRLLEVEPFLTNLEDHLQNLSFGEVVDVGNLEKTSALALRDIYSSNYEVFMSEDNECKGRYALGFELKYGNKK